MQITQVDIVKGYHTLPDFVLKANGLLPPHELYSDYDEVYHQIKNTWTEMGRWLRHLVLGEFVPDLNPIFKPLADIVNAENKLIIETNYAAKRLRLKELSSNHIWALVEFRRCESTFKSVGYFGDKSSVISKSKRKEMIDKKFHKHYKFLKLPETLTYKKISDTVTFYESCVSELFYFSQDITLINNHFLSLYKNDNKTTEEIYREVLDWYEHHYRTYQSEIKRAWEKIRKTPDLKVFYLKNHKLNWINKYNRRPAIDCLPS